MTITTLSRRFLALAILAAPLAGCSGDGTTVDTKPTAPPVTKDNLKDMSKDINAGAAGMKPPGVTPPKTK